MCLGVFGNSKKDFALRRLPGVYMPVCSSLLYLRLCFVYFIDSSIERQKFVNVPVPVAWLFSYRCVLVKKHGEHFFPLWFCSRVMLLPSEWENRVLWTTNARHAPLLRRARPPMPAVCESGRLRSWCVTSVSLCISWPMLSSDTLTHGSLSLPSHAWRRTYAHCLTLFAYTIAYCKIRNVYLKFVGAVQSVRRSREE